MNYLSPLCNNIALAQAIEEMMGIEVTPRCAAIRVILAELAGYGSTDDAFHITQPAPEGAGAREAMKRAIQDAG